MSKETIKKLSDIRVDSSIILNTMKAMDKKHRSRGLSLAITSLEKGRMYLGEVQRDLGAEFPYEATKKATTPEGIQKAVDTSDKVLPLNEDNEIINLNNLRTVLDKKIDETLDVITWFAKEHRVGNLTQKFLRDANLTEGYRSIKEARMWLGVRLGEIKDNE